MTKQQEQSEPLSILICQIARTVYGTEDPKWMYFREYLLFRALKPIRCFYIANAFWISEYIRHRPGMRRILRLFMDIILWYDSATRTL
jgi:hypothetical protein